VILEICDSACFYPYYLWHVWIIKHSEHEPHTPLCTCTAQRWRDWRHPTRNTSNYLPAWKIIQVEGGRENQTHPKSNIIWCLGSHFLSFLKYFFLSTIVLSAFLSTTQKNSFQNHNTPLTSLLIWWNVHIFYITSLITLGQKQWIERHQVSAAELWNKGIDSQSIHWKRQKNRCCFLQIYQMRLWLQQGKARLANKYLWEQNKIVAWRLWELKHLGRNKPKCLSLNEVSQIN